MDSKLFHSLLFASVLCYVRSLVWKNDRTDRFDHIPLANGGQDSPILDGLQGTDEKNTDQKNDPLGSDALMSDKIQRKQVTDNSNTEVLNQRVNGNAGTSNLQLTGNTDAQNEQVTGPVLLQPEGGNQSTIRAHKSTTAVSSYDVWDQWESDTEKKNDYWYHDTDLDYLEPEVFGDGELDGYMDIGAWKDLDGDTEELLPPSKSQDKDNNAQENIHKQEDIIVDKFGDFWDEGANMMPYIKEDLITPDTFHKHQGVKEEISMMTHYLWIIFLFFTICAMCIFFRQLHMVKNYWTKINGSLHKNYPTCSEEGKSVTKNMYA